MRTLSAQELRTYDEQGFLLVPGVFPTEELESLDQEIDHILGTAGQKAAEHLPGWIQQVGTYSELTSAFSADERLLTLIEDIVKPGIAIHSTKLVAKPPHFAEVCHWHQDEAFYRRPDDPNTFRQTRMSAWVPFQDTDERNGCLWVVPGSQRWGLQPYEQVDYGQCRRRLDPVEYLAQAIPLRVQAGDVVFFSAWLWHHSRGNDSDRVRRSFIISYQEAPISPELEQRWKVLRAASDATATAR
jgi:phytanoyl-CoA hydroxylase